MRKLVAILFILVAVVPLSAPAGEFADLKKKLVDARYSLYIMLDNGDRRDAVQQKRVKDTADAVSAALAGLKAPAGKEARFKEMADTWKAFKKTREEVLVPLILSGKQKEAEKLATGIQNERFKKVMDLCDELER